MNTIKYTAITCLAKAIITLDTQLLSMANELIASLSQSEIKEAWEQIAPILSEREIQWYKNSLSILKTG
jgi:hypothetical protein